MSTFHEALGRAWRAAGGLSLSLALVFACAYWETILTALPGRRVMPIVRALVPTTVHRFVNRILSRARGS